MKFIDWFAGIGGFRRGMELAGHEGEWFCSNGSSDYWFDWTDYSDSCEEWEGRNEL